MCGIAGYWNFNGQFEKNILTEKIKKMTDTMVARGPDSNGYWTDPEIGIAFGHRRLAIIDLTDAGAQPMMSRDQRYIIVYNGEIYNTENLRRQLTDEGVKFRGDCDTEVILEGVSKWGLTSTLNKLNGIFAFAIWDSDKNCLSLVRDRLGVKPLYWHHDTNKFIFASELKAILTIGDIRPVVDRSSICDFLRYSYILAPHTIYKSINYEILFSLTIYRD